MSGRPSHNCWTWRTMPIAEASLRAAGLARAASWPDEDQVVDELLTAIASRSHDDRSRACGGGSFVVGAGRAIGWRPVGPRVKLTKHLFVTGGVATHSAKVLPHPVSATCLSPGPAGLDAEAGPVPQCRSGHHEPVSARRGLRHEDGAETDLDVSHYEHFVNVDLSGDARCDDRRGVFVGDRQGIVAATILVTLCRSSRTSQTRSKTPCWRWAAPTSTS